jgi:hypothetical protein
MPLIVMPPIIKRPMPEYFSLNHTSRESNKGSSFALCSRMLKFLTVTYVNASGIWQWPEAPVRIFELEWLHARLEGKQDGTQPLPLI